LESLIAQLETNNSVLDSKEESIESDTNEDSNHAKSVTVKEECEENNSLQLKDKPSSSSSSSHIVKMNTQMRQRMFLFRLNLRLQPVKHQIQSNVNQLALIPNKKQLQSVFQVSIHHQTHTQTLIIIYMQISSKKKLNAMTLQC